MGGNKNNTNKEDLKAAEAVTKRVWAQGERMRQAGAISEAGQYSPDPNMFRAGQNRGGGIVDFGYNYQRPYQTSGLDDLKRDASMPSPLEMGEADIINPLENIQDAGALQEQYYDIIEKANYLAREASSQGWRINQTNISDPNKRALSETYQAMKAQALELGNVLKSGYEVREQGMEEGRILEAMQPNQTVYNERQLLDKNMLDSDVDDINEAARTTYSSGQKAELNNYLNARRQEYVKQADFLDSQGRTEEAKLYRNAAGRIGLSDRNLDQEKLAWKQKAYNLNKRPKYNTVISIADSVAKIDQTLQEDPTTREMTSNVLNGRELIDGGVIENVSVDEKGIKTLTVRRTYTDKATGERKSSSESITMPSDRALVSQLIQGIYDKPDEYLDVWNDLSSELGLIGDKDMFSDNAYSLGSTLNLKDQREQEGELGQGYKEVFKNVEELKEDPSGYFSSNNPESDGDLRKQSILYQEGGMKLSDEEAIEKFGDANILAQKISVGKKENLNPVLNKYNSIYITPAKGFFADDGSVHVMGVDANGKAVKITDEDKYPFGYNGTSKENAIKKLEEYGIEDASQSVSDYIDNFNNRTLGKDGEKVSIIGNIGYGDGNKINSGW